MRSIFSLLGKPIQAVGDSSVGGNIISRMKSRVSSTTVRANFIL